MQIRSGMSSCHRILSPRSVSLPRCTTLPLTMFGYPQESSFSYVLCLASLSVRVFSHGAEGSSHYLNRYPFGIKSNSSAPSWVHAIFEAQSPRMLSDMFGLAVPILTNRGTRLSARHVPTSFSATLSHTSGDDQPQTLIASSCLDSWLHRFKERGRHRQRNSPP